jgi:hypothetical protein
MSFKSDIVLKLSNIADGLITGAKLVANTITFNKIQQIGAYKTLANITGSDGNISEVNIGYIPNGSVTLSGNVTYAKADFTGRTHLLLSTNDTTTRTFTVSNTGFTAGDFICLLINQNSSGDVSVVIGSTGSPRSLTNNRGNLLNCLFDGTDWHIWGGSGVFNTVSSTFSSTASGLRARAVGGSNTASGVNSLANQTLNTAYGNSSQSTGTIGTGVSEGGGTAVGYQSVSNADSSTSLGANNSSNGFAFHTGLGAGVLARRFGALRRRLNIYPTNLDSTGFNPSIHSEIVSWNGTTSNATITELFLFGHSSNRCVLQAKNVLSFRGQAVAYRSNYAGSARWTIEGLIKRDGSNNTTLVGVTATLTHSDGTGNTLVLTITADDTNEALRVQVTGNASETWTWGVELELLDLRIA